MSRKELIEVIEAELEDQGVVGPASLAEDLADRLNLEFNVVDQEDEDFEEEF